MFKYKDIRMVVVCVMVLILCITGLFVFSGDKFKMIMLCFLMVSLLPIFVTQYNNSVFEDGMVIHTFRGIAILPEVIDFKHIKECERVGRYKIVVIHKHNKKSVAYTTHAKSFIEEFENKYTKYKNK